MRLSEAEAWLESRIDHAATGAVAGKTDLLDLGSMTELMAAVGDPHEAYRVIHITGTNGKGSTGRMTTSILDGLNLSVGTYSSPHLSSITERIQHNGEAIPDDDFGRLVGLLASIVDRLEHRPTHFDLLTAVALLWFAEIAVDVAVIEVGMLGRFDSTNVVDADVAVFTSLGKDHTDGADGWRERIAWEKAGIAMAGRPAILGVDDPTFIDAIEAESPEPLIVRDVDLLVEDDRIALGGRVVDLTTPWGQHDDLFVPVHGAHQAGNLAVAVAAVEALLDRAIDDEVLAEALQTVTIPGRFEVVAREPSIVLDGAHNPDGARTVRHTLDHEFRTLGSEVLVIGATTGKDPVEMLTAFGADRFDAVIICEPDFRPMPAADVAAAAAELGIAAEVVRDPIDALARARAVTSEQDLIVVSGSLYVVGTVRGALVELARRAGTDDLLD